MPLNSAVVVNAVRVLLCRDVPSTVRCQTRCQSLARWLSRFLPRLKSFLSHSCYDIWFMCRLTPVLRVRPARALLALFNIKILSTTKGEVAMIIFWFKMASLPLLLLLECMFRALLLFVNSLYYFYFYVYFYIYLFYRGFKFSPILFFSVSHPFVLTIITNRICAQYSQVLFLQLKLWPWCSQRQLCPHCSNRPSIITHYILYIIECDIVLYNVNSIVCNSVETLSVSSLACVSQFLLLLLLLMFILGLPRWEWPCQAGPISDHETFIE